MLLAQDRTDGVRNIAGREGCCGNLIEQRLKEVVIATINKSDLNVLAAQSSCSVEPTESTADNHNPCSANFVHGEMITRVHRGSRVP